LGRKLLFVFPLTNAQLDLTKRKMSSEGKKEKKKSCVCNPKTWVVYHLIRKPDWSSGVVNGKRQNPNGNFQMGFAVPFTVASDPIRKAWNWSERANGMHNFRSETPFGNFGPPRNPIFPGNFPFGKTKLVFHLHSNRNFQPRTLALHAFPAFQFSIPTH